MSKPTAVQTANGIDYVSWLKHELLTLSEISLLAKGVEPTPINLGIYNASCVFRTCQISSILLSSCKAGQIKTYSNGNASPIECLLYLKHMDIPLPADLLYVLENNIEEIQKYLSTKIKGKRTKESYQKKEVRGDEQVLEAVLRTLIDLFPELTKDALIDLKPVQEYANGKKHSREKLMKMITDIEGGNRKSGNVHKSKKDEAMRTLPQSWKDYETSPHTY
ncbi:MAG: hypothetical protein JSS12_07520 [Verrucomicrobia bacterium]|nr:hypothetical protein [Verrucomicrobiota bacterium]